jgi:hypothetical protein
MTDKEFTAQMEFWAFFFFAWDGLPAVSLGAHVLGGHSFFGLGKVLCLGKVLYKEMAKSRNVVGVRV